MLASVLIQFHSILPMLLESHLILCETRDSEMFSDLLKTMWPGVARGQKRCQIRKPHRLGLNPEASAFQLCDLKPLSPSVPGCLDSKSQPYR